MKTADEIKHTRDIIIEMIKNSGRDIIDVDDEDPELWTVSIKHGEYVVNVEHEPINDFFIVGFYGEIQDDDTLKTINSIIKDNPGEFYFSFVSTISYPFTSFQLLSEEDEQFSGFLIYTNIFPFERDFSIRNLDAAIQNVLNASIIGWTFIGFIVGGKLLQQKITEMYTSSPDGMFG